MKDVVFSLVALLMMTIAGSFVAQTTLEHIFLAVSAVTVFAASRVVLSNSAVHSALFLILTFFSVAVLWIVQGAEFLGVVLVLVYVGAVMVLLLFVVMMVSMDKPQTRASFWNHFPTAFLMGVLVLAEMGVVVWQLFLAKTDGFASVAVVNVAQTNVAQTNASVHNSQALAQLLFGDYAIAFELVGLILLVAMVAALVLTLGARKRMQSQNIDAQVRVKAADRLHIQKDQRSLDRS